MNPKLWGKVRPRLIDQTEDYCGKTEVLKTVQEEQREVREHTGSGRELQIRAKDDEWWPVADVTKRTDNRFDKRLTTQLFLFQATSKSTFLYNNLSDMVIYYHTL